MTACDLETLVLLGLCDRTGKRADHPAAGRSIRTLADAVGLEDTLTDRLRLAAALSALEGDGYLALVDDTGVGPTYRLTAAGRERAEAVAAELATERVVVADGDERRELPLESVPSVFDVSIPTALSLQAPDGTIYLEPDLEPAFVGREAERDRLLETLETADEGPPTTALVTGEPGIGKTALIERFRSDARERGFATAVGRCRRDGGGPYHPFRDAFDAAPGEDEPFPGVDATPPSAHDEATYETQLEAFYDRVTASLAARAVERPLVLVIEDLQWADAATIDLLERLLETDTDAPLVVCCTARPGDPGVEESLEGLLERIGSAELGSRLPLEALDHETITELVERHVGQRGVPRSFVDAVAEETGGNPLFVVETVEVLLADGAIDPRHDHYSDDPASVAVSDIVQTTIGSRLERLDTTTRRVLEVGAVIGDVVPIELLRQVTGHVASSLSSHVDRLIEARLWQRPDEETVRFPSDVVRSVVRDGIDDDRAGRLHRQVADAMAGTGEDCQEACATIAAHYERGGMSDRALESWLVAADRAMEWYAHDDAIDWYKRALGIARDRDRDETVLQILESLGDVHYTRGEYERADRQFRYIRERTDDPERIRRTYRYQARVRFERGEYDETERYASAGLEVGPADAVTHEVCWLHDYLAGAAKKRGDLEAAIEGFETQRELATEIDDDLLLGRAYQNLGVCITNRGEPERGVEAIERAVPLLESAGDDRELARCLNDLGAVCHGNCQYERAADAFERSQSLATETGSPRVAALAGANLGVIAIWQARWADAESALEEAAAVADRVDNEELYGFALGKLGTIERERGRLEDAIESLERGRDILHDVESPRHCAQVHITLGFARILRGSFAAATTEIDCAIELATDHDYPRWRARGAAMRGCLEREQGRLEDAIESQREGLEIARDSCSDETVANIASQFTETLCRAGDGERALEQGRSALEAAPEGYRFLHRRATVAYAGALRRTGAHDDVRSRLEPILEAEGVSNVTRLRCLRELGLLEYETGAPGLGRKRLEAGRELAGEIGAETPAARFDALLEGGSEDDPFSVNDTDANLPVRTTDSDRRPSERDGKPGAAER